MPYLALEENSMLCPQCMTELVPGNLERFETLDEHVTCSYCEDPRPTVVCPNHECSVFWNKVYWSAEGEGPYRSYPQSEAFKWVDGNPSPFGSWFRKTHFSIDYNREDSEFNLGRVRIRRKVRYLSNDFGDKVNKRVRYEFYYKNIYYIPGVRMLYFVLSQFYKNRDREGPQIIESAKWPNAEWWRKVASFWVRTFHGSSLKTAT